MHEALLPFGIGHPQIVNPVDASICLILMLDMTKRSLLDQRRPVLYPVVTCTGMSMSKRPLLLSPLNRLLASVSLPGGNPFAGGDGPTRLSPDSSCVVTNATSRVGRVRSQHF
jgi:hypothetical protein